MQKTLAIVIPAYKPDFLEKTLASLAAQTCQEFSLYIGDDASPFDLKQILDKFSNSLQAHYVRFDENLGKQDLVAHWERCIRLSQDEEWVYLFSDDDMMQSGCIEAFQQYPVNDQIDVLHFNLDLIDEQDHVIQECPSFPEVLDSSQFFNKLFRRQIVARMPEFIFRRSKLKECGLIHFDLAWRSDTALVMSAAFPGGIHTLSGPESKVQWRASHSNISGIEELKRRKNMVNIDFFNWAHDYYHKHGIQLPMSRFYLTKTIVFALEWYGWQGLASDGMMTAQKLKSAAGLRFLVPLFIVYRLIYRLFE